MSWMLSAKTFIPLGLFHYFNAGATRDEALTNLLKSTKKNPEYFPRIDYREIDFWYNSFQNGNFDIDQEPTYPDLSKLENLPVLHQILHEVNAEDQKSLRQVCTKFKAVIDKENRLYDEIQLRLATNSISLQVKNGIDEKTTKSIYTQKGEGCEIKTGKTTTLSEDSFLKKALSDFKTTIKKVNTKVEQLVVKHKQNVSEPIRNEFFAGIAAVLKGLKTKLHVEILELTVDTPNHLNGILGGIKEKSLLQLEVDVLNHPADVFRLSEVPNFSSHLSHLERISIDEKVDIKMVSFAHVEAVSLTFDAIASEDLLNYKKRILESPNFCSHNFWSGEITDEMAEGFRNALAPFDLADDQFEEDETEIVLSGRFPIPGDNENYIFFKLENYHITFSKKEIDFD